MVLLSTTVGLPSRIRRLGRALDLTESQGSLIAVFYCFIRFLYLRIAEDVGVELQARPLDTSV